MALPLGIIAIAFGFVCLVVGFRNDEKSQRTARVGDVFVHANPGKTYTPWESSEPFAQIYQILEIRDGNAKLRVKTVYLNGKPGIEYERWEFADKVGLYDTKISNQ